MFRLSPLLLTAPLALCISATVAEEMTYNVEIPAQSLATALETLAQQTGIKPFYKDSLVAGKKIWRFPEGFHPGKGWRNCCHPSV